MGYARMGACGPSWVILGTWSPERGDAPQLQFDILPLGLTCGCLGILSAPSLEPCGGVLGSLGSFPALLGAILGVSPGILGGCSGAPHCKLHGATCFGTHLRAVFEPPRGTLWFS